MLRIILFSNVMFGIVTFVSTIRLLGSCFKAFRIATFVAVIILGGGELKRSILISCRDDHHGSCVGGAVAASPKGRMEGDDRPHHDSTI